MIWRPNDEKHMESPGDSPQALSIRPSPAGGRVCTTSKTSKLNSRILELTSTPPASAAEQPPPIILAYPKRSQNQ